MTRAKSWTKLALVLLPLGFGVAVAQPGEDIWVGPEPVARIYAKGSHDSVTDRRVAIEQAINGVVASQDMEKAEVSLKQEADLWTIYVGGTKIMSVYPEDAAAHVKEPADLAAEWRDNLKTQLPKAARVEVTEITIAPAPVTEETVTEEPITGRPETEVVVEEPATGAATNLGDGETETVTVTVPATQPTFIASEGAKLLIVDSFNKVRDLSEDGYIVQRDSLAANLLSYLAQLGSGAESVVISVAEGEPEVGAAGSEGGYAPVQPPVAPTPEVEVEAPSTATATSWQPADISEFISEEELNKGVIEGDPAWANVPQKRRIGKKFRLANEPYYELKSNDPVAAQTIGDLLHTAGRELNAQQFDACEQHLDQALRVLGVIK